MAQHLWRVVSRALSVARVIAAVGTVACARTCGRAAGVVAARELALRQQEDAEVLNDMSWRVVARPHASDTAYRLALRQVQRACELSPDDYMCFNTLGIALYRCAEYERALSTLRRSDALNRGGDDEEEEGASNSEDVAFLAMTFWKLGQKDEARRELQHLRDLMEDRPHDEDGAAFLVEALALIEG